MRFGIRVEIPHDLHRSGRQFAVGVFAQLVLDKNQLVGEQLRCLGRQCVLAGGSRQRVGQFFVCGCMQ